VEVTDLVVKDNDLVVGTNGRSLWIFDDLTPVRDSSWRTDEEAAVLLPVQPAIRWRFHPPVYGMRDRYAGDNPPAGAFINYYLKAKPKGVITLEILDADGKLVNTFNSKEEPPEFTKDDPDAPSEIVKKTVLTTEPGINRVVWNLQYAGALKIKPAKIDAGEPQTGPLALPGTYMLRLRVNGKTLPTKATIAPDPRVKIPMADLRKQLELILAIRADISRLTSMVDQIRSLRVQLQAREKLLQNNAKAKPLISLGQKLIKKLDTLEAKLHNPRAEVTYDILAQKGGAQLYSQLIFLYEALKDSDGLPTQGVQEVYAEMKKELVSEEAEIKKLLADDLARLNDRAKTIGVPNVIVPAAAAGGGKR
jgi:hypothetical protein